MFKIQIPDEVIDHCKTQARKHNFGMRGIYDGTTSMQIVGLIGQQAMMNIFGTGIIDGRTGPDGGVDIEYHGLKIDVKTMGRTTDPQPGYVNNFMKVQEKYNPDIYIFCSYNALAEELTVCGWVTNQQFKERRKFYPEGYIRTRKDGTSFPSRCDMYEITNRDLNQVNEPLDLLTQITTK